MTAPKVTPKLPVFITVTVCVNPLVVPTIWGSKVTPTGVALTVLVDAVPVPESVTVRGLPGALSVIVIVPVRPPPAVGVKVTLIWQLVAGAVPARGTAVRQAEVAGGQTDAVNRDGRVPALVTLMVCWLELVLITWLGKTSLGRSTTILGAATRPFPEIEVVRGLPGASSVMVTVAVLLPLAVV